MDDPASLAEGAFEGDYGDPSGDPPTTPPIILEAPVEGPSGSAKPRKQRAPRTGVKEQKHQKPRKPRKKEPKKTPGAAVCKDVKQAVDQAKDDLRMFYLWEIQSKGYTRDMVKQKIEALDHMPEHELLFEADCYRIEQQSQNTNHLSRIARDTLSKAADHVLKANGHVEKALQGDPAFQDTLSSILDTSSTKLPVPAKLGLSVFANVFKGMLDKRRADAALKHEILEDTNKKPT